MSAPIRAHEVSPERAYVDAIARCYADAPFDSGERLALLSALTFACMRLGYDVAIVLDAARAEARGSR